MSERRASEERQSERYLIQAGWVISQNDGDRHWVPAAQLARLYGLRDSQWRAWHPRLDRESDLPGAWPAHGRRLPAGRRQR